ncbi:MAG: hypothetical protein ACRD3B_12275 [Candidatus Sulfotelmatobacter sp.]
MKTLLFALLGLATFASAQNSDVERLGDTPVETKFTSGGRIRMDLCPSRVDLVGSNESVVRVSYHPERDDVKVRLQVSGDSADLSVTSCPHPFRITIAVPKASGLYVRMFAGELNLSDVTGDKDIVLHFGHLNMDVGSPEKYGRVEASVNSGDLQASAFGVSKGGLFRSFDQKGPGNFRLYAHMGAGELALR